MQNEYTHPVSLQVPYSATHDEPYLREYLAAKLYGDCKLSLYEAANMAGIPKWDFPKVFKRFDVPYFNLTPGDLERDIDNA